MCIAGVPDASAARCARDGAAESWVPLGGSLTAARASRWAGEVGPCQVAAAVANRLLP